MELPVRTDPRLVLTPDLSGQEIACLVIAAGPGGTAQVSSEPILVAEIPAETAGPA